ncbi:MAG: hypothetical protein IPK22_12295 [Verrucomicrobiaceae bacterium]|nr:hypothetical protein [Verrucomicrobiaceae bacterium]
MSALFHGVLFSWFRSQNYILQPSYFQGAGQSPEIILRDDGFDGDLGYPRTIVRPDGRVLTVYYFNGPQSSDRAVEATLWTPLRK